MNEKLKSFLDQKRAEGRVSCESTKVVDEEEKNAMLLKLDLCEREYSQENKRSAEYPCCDYTTGRYYKEVPIKVTDEEYQELIKYANETQHSNASGTSGGVTPWKVNNNIADVLQFFAWVLYIGGFITGIVFGNESIDVGFYSFSHTETKFMWSVALTHWCTAAVSGTILLGFAEIIKLLEAIKNK